MRRLLVISHTYVEPQNRGKLRALAASGPVAAVVPAVWRDRTLGRTWRIPAETTDGEVRIIPAPWWGPCHPSLGLLRVPVAELRRPGTVVQLEEEPWTPTALLVAASCDCNPLCLFTWENLPSRMPVPWSLIERIVLGRATGVIAGSRGAEAVVRGLGFDRPIEVIPQLGVAIPAPLRPRQRDDALRIAYVGRLVTAKGVDVLLHAAARVRSPIRLTVVGDGPARSRLERLTARLGLDPSTVCFAGALPPPEVATRWAVTDVLVLPSRRTPRWTEQFGHVLIEAMAHEVAVIGSGTGAIPEVIAGAGIVIPAGDPVPLAEALDELARDRERLAVLGRAGRMRAEQHFSDAVLAARTRAFHATMMRERA